MTVNMFKKKPKMTPVIIPSDYHNQTSSHSSSLLPFSYNLISAYPTRNSPVHSWPFAGFSHYG